MRLLHTTRGNRMAVSPNRKYIKLFCAVCSFAGAYAIKNIFATKTDTVFYSNSFIPVAVFAGFYFLILNAFSKADKRRMICGVIFGFILSATLTTGRFVYINEAPVYSFANIIGTLTNAILFTPTVTALFIHISLFYDSMQRHDTAEANKFSSLVTRIFEKHTFFKITVVIFIGFLPCFLAFYPGIYGYDINSQMTEFLSGNYSTFHPLLHTLFYSSASP